MHYLERETGYNTAADEPRPGECYCHLLRGSRLCQVCIDDLVHPSTREAWMFDFHADVTECSCEEDKVCDEHRRASRKHALRQGWISEEEATA